jgi:DNA replication protein DnaC
LVGGSVEKMLDRLRAEMADPVKMAAREAEFERQELEHERRRREIAVQLLPATLGRMGVPKRIASAVAEEELAASAGGARRYCTAALAAAARWAEGSKAFLLLLGGSGSGKTCAAVSILARPGVRGSFIEAVALARMSKFEDGGEWERMLRIPWLVVDDLGTEGLTKFFEERIFELVNRRQADGKRTVFTANLTLSEFKSRVGARIESRMRADIQATSCGDLDLRQVAAKGAP